MLFATTLLSILLSTCIFHSSLVCSLERAVGDARLTLAAARHNKVLNDLDDVWNAHKGFETTSLAEFETRAGAKDKRGPQQARWLQDDTIKVRKQLLSHLARGYQHLHKGSYLLANFWRGSAKNELKILRKLEKKLVGSGYHIAYLDMEDGRRDPMYTKRYEACSTVRDACLAQAATFTTAHQAFSPLDASRVYPYPLANPNAVSIEPHSPTEAREDASSADASPEHSSPARPSKTENNQG